MSLVLSLFPGLDVLGMGFEAEGFTVVTGPDLIWGRDMRGWSVPRGRFDGITGGPPCQTFSSLANLVRAKGLEPSFGNLIPEFMRCVEEATPSWFLMENVPGVPFELWPRPAGYSVASFLIDNWASLGQEQSRERRFWFGQRGEKVAELRRWIEFATELPPDAMTVVAGHDAAPGQRDRFKRLAVTSDQREVPVAIGGSGKVKRTAVTGLHPGEIGATPYKKPTVDGHAQHNKLGGINRGYAPRYSIAEMLELQGLPKDLLDHAPFTMQGKRKLVGNAVPLPMARALARAVRRATESP